MDRGPHPDFATWVVTHGDPKAKAMLERPRRALVTTRTYAGDTVLLELDVVARAKGYVCVRQELAGRGPWHAWIPAEQAVPV